MKSPKPDLIVGGAPMYRGFLDATEQASLLDQVREIIEGAPLFSPETRWGKQMSVRMSSAGDFGWYADRRGYRYIDTHPSGAPWPPIPSQALSIWHTLCPGAPAPQCCLLNYYTDTAKMGMHQDRDEVDFSQPVLSISLGDDALFRIGGPTRGGKTQSVWLASGDVLLLKGSARLAYHGIDRIRTGSSTLLPEGGRFNLTLRVVE